MKNRPPTNLPASIHQRLLNVSKKSGRPFNDLDQIKELVGNVCTVDVEADGLVFESESVVTIRIVEDTDYAGVRANFKGSFGKMPLAMQIDFGFSDVITPGPVAITYPSVLDHPPAQLMAYNRETLVSEKFEAMVKLSELNSRMKDFFDVWVLARNFAFQEEVLAAAIRSTFARRETEIDSEAVCFAENVAHTPAKGAQWKAFLKTSRVSDTPDEFSEVVAQVRAFLQPLAKAIIVERGHDRRWQPGGPWAKQ